METYSRKIAEEMEKLDQMETDENKESVITSSHRVNPPLISLWQGSPAAEGSSGNE